MCIFEAAKTGKNKVWMVQTSPSVWKLRKWIRAWRKLLVLGSCMGSLAKTYTTAISSTCTFFAKTIKYKMRKIEMREICRNHFEICFHSVKSVSLCRKSVFGKSSAELPKTRERCDKFAGRIASSAQNPNFGHRKTIKLWIEWIIWIIWNYKLNFRTKWQKSQKSYFLCVARKVCPMHCSTLW